MFLSGLVVAAWLTSSRWVAGEGPDAAGTLPPPWTSTDIGVVGLPGSATFSDGVFTVQGAGADIWAGADGFHFVWQPLSGDGTIVARVATITNTHVFAKAGVMLRATLSPGSPHVILNVKPNGGLEFMTRRAPGGSTTYLDGAPAAAPVWLRLARNGSVVVGSWSADGLEWHEVGRTTIALPHTIYAGLPVTSHQKTRLNTSTFDRVHVSAGHDQKVLEPPGVPSVPLPPNGATGVLTDVALNWQPVSGASKYDVAFGRTDSPPIVAADHDATVYQPQAPLAHGATYYWRVTAKGEGGVTVGPLWSFTTEPLPAPAVPPPSTALKRLRVLTWNVNGGRNHEHVADVDGQVRLIARSGAHVIVLQNVTIESGADLPVIYPSKLEARTRQTWHVVWAGEPRPAPATARGNMILSSLPLAAHATLDLDGAPSAPHDVDAKRSAARIVVIVNDVPLTIATTALSMAPASRLTQIAQLESWLRESPGPRLIGGSFNMRANDAGYAELASAFSDVWARLVKTPDAGTTTASFAAGGGPARVDGWWQDLGDARALATEVWVVKTARSDHHAVAADVEVR